MEKIERKKSKTPTKIKKCNKVHKNPKKTREKNPLQTLKIQKMSKIVIKAKNLKNRFFQKI